MNVSNRLFIFLNSTSNQDEMENNHPASIFYGFTVFYSVIFIFGFFGNLLVITSVIRFPKMRTVFNTFLVNLSIADLLFTVISILHAVQFLKNDVWVFGDLACKLQATLIETSYTASVFTLTVVAHERYSVTCNYTRRRKTFTEAIKTCVIVWFLSLLICSCMMYGSGQMVDEDGMTKCRNDNWSKTIRISFYGIHTVIVYFIPMVVMFSAHVLIARELKRSRENRQRKKKQKQMHLETKGSSGTHGEDNDKQQVDSLNLKYQDKVQTLKNKRTRKVIRLLTTVSTVFLIIWTPFIVVRLFKYGGVKINTAVWQASQLMMFSNTAANSIIYYVMNFEFRKCFKRILSCTTQRKYDMDQPCSKGEPEKLEGVYVVSSKQIGQEINL